jgi:hypothetical protein
MGRMEISGSSRICRICRMGRMRSEEKIIGLAGCRKKILIILSS